MKEVLFDLVLIFALVYSAATIINFRIGIIAMEKKAAKESARKAHISALAGDNLSAHKWEKLREKL